MTSKIYASQNIRDIYDFLINAYNAKIDSTTLFDTDFLFQVVKDGGEFDLIVGKNHKPLKFNQTYLNMLFGIEDPKIRKTKFKEIKLHESKLHLEIKLKTELTTDDVIAAINKLEDKNFSGSLYLWRAQLQVCCFLAAKFPQCANEIYKIA